MTKKLLTLENIRSGDVPSDAVAVGFLLGEIEKLNRKCGALAYLQYGSAGPDDPWQGKLDEVTKPLHVEIESLRKALDNRSRQLGIQPTVHEPEKQA